MTLTVSAESHGCSHSSVDVGEEFQAYKYALFQFAGVALTDLQGKILEINECFCKLLGYEQSELIGEPYSQFASCLPSELEAHQLWEAIAEGSPWRGEVRHGARNGSHHWLDTHVIPLKSATGQVNRYLFVGRDITEQRQVKEREQSQRQALMEQQAQNKALHIRLDGNNHILNLIVNGAPLAQSLTAIAKLTERLAEGIYCAIMVVDPRSGHLFHQAAPSLPPAFIDMMDNLPITLQGGAFAAAAHGKRSMIVPDIAADTHAHYVNDVALQYDLKGCWACPILVREKVVAVLGMYYSQPQYPGEADQNLMAKAVELTQVAMERHRSATALGKKLEQTLLLGQITQEIRQSLEIQEVFQTAVTQLRHLLQADRVVIARLTTQASEIDEENETSPSLSQDLCDHFIAEDVIPPFRSILGLALNGQCPSSSQNHLLTAPASSQTFPSPLTPAPQDPTAPILLEDIYYAGLNDDEIVQLEALEIHASIAVPIMGNDGNSRSSRPWGMLYIQQCSNARQWQESEISFVQALAVQLSIAIQQADLLNQAQQKSARLQHVLETVQRQKRQQSRLAERERVVSRVIQQLHKTRDITKILATTTQEARSLLHCDRILIYRFLPDWSREIAHESCDPALPTFKQTPPILTWVDHNLQQNQGGRYRNGESAVVADIHESDYSDEHIQCFAQRDIYAFIVVPIFVGDQLWGLMGAYQHHKPRNWKFEDLNALERISGQLGVAFQQAELLKQLKAAKDKADLANQAKGTFLANMSHELRTPLNAILGFSQLMCRDSAATPDQQDKLNIINRSGAHLLSLINDVLDMSKIEAGSMVLNAEEFDLYALCDSVYELFYLKAQSKGLELKLERGAEVPQYIYSDERKLRQILMNLISNSLKFTSNGSITLKLWKGEMLPSDSISRLSTTPVKLWFSVTDTGQGVAAQEMDRLFETFGQTESGRLAQEGTGLGLPISREFAQLLGGELTLDSKLNQGMIARFSAVVSPVLEKPVSSSQKQRISSIAPGQPDYRLLVVEDRPKNRLLLTQLLECVGFSVRTAENGEAAIAQWQDWKPHLIWMDLQMPVMDGFEATRRIRLLETQQQAISQDSSFLDAPKQKDAETTKMESSPPLESKTYILAITASAFEETRTSTLEAGFDDFIGKPFSEDLLFKKLTQYLGVTYCYETLRKSPSTDPKVAITLHGPEQLHIQQQCRAMGRAWQKSVYQAASNLDEEMLQQHINLIGTGHNQLKTLLQSWAQMLRFDKITELVQQPFQDSA